MSNIKEVGIWIVAQETRTYDMCHISDRKQWKIGEACKRDKNSFLHYRFIDSSYFCEDFLDAKSTRQPRKTLTDKNQKK